MAKELVKIAFGPKSGGHEALVPGLPARPDFVRRGPGAGQTAALEQRILQGVAVHGTVQKPKRIKFLPVDVKENTDYVGGRAAYQLNLFGVLETGAKAHVIVTDIYPFFDVRVPDSKKKPEAFRDSLEETLRGAVGAGAVKSLALISAYPLMGYRERPVDWVRVRFFTTKPRKEALALVAKAGHETASNVTAHYFRAAAMFHNFNVANWNTIEGYDYFRGGAHPLRGEPTGAGNGPHGAYHHKKVPKLSPLCEHVFYVRAADVKAYVDPLADFADKARGARVAAKVAAAPALARDKTLVMTWDIETYNGQENKTEVPRAWNPADRLFMIGITAHWKNDAAPLAQVCLVGGADAAAAPGWATVVCGSEADLVRAFAAVYRGFAPDVVAGFNDGDYDWPYLVYAAANHGLLGHLVAATNAAPRVRWDPSQKAHYAEVLRETEAAKWHFRTGYDGGTDDGEYAMRKPKTQPDGGDGDRVRWDYTVARRKAGQRVKISAEQNEHIKFLKVPGSVPIDDRIVFQKLFPRAETGSKSSSLNYYLKMCGLESKAEMTPHEMWDYFEKNDAPKMRDVANYCIIDALRCQELLLKRNVINDYVEKVTLSYTCLADAHLYADSGKVGGMLASVANFRGILCSNTVSEDEGEGKYPGAFVFPPKKGLYPDPAAPASVAFERKRADIAANFAKNFTGESKLEKTTGQAPKPPAVLRAMAARIMESARAGTLEKDHPAIFAVLAKYAPRRPVTGLDFASLYPSIIMAYNMSPETYVATEEQAAEVSKTRSVRRVDFVYNGKPVVAWFVWHDNDPKKMGLFPTILKSLFDRRAAMKKQLAVYEELKEHMEHVMGLVEKRKEGGPGPPAPKEDPHPAPQGGDPLPAVVAGERAAAAAKAAALAAAEAAAAARGDDAHARRLAAERAGLQHTLDYLARVAGEPPAAQPAAFQEEYQTASFGFMSVDSKQKALKVYMNTFYGVAGSRLSPFFLLPLAGGVTSKGQYNIKLVADYVLKKQFEICYGDTDSLYLSCPQSAFRELDVRYLVGDLKTREDYWTEQVKLTMGELDGLRDKVNARLRADNGTGFLRMAYEEVLFPVAMTGKKKYYGIAHVNIPNFRPKKLFIRGIDVVKQGQTDYAKKIGGRIMWASVDLANERDLLAITRDVFRDAVLNTEQWKFEDFRQSARWRPEKKNLMVLHFMARMRAQMELEADRNRARAAEGLPPLPALYHVPDPGARFWYVYAKKSEMFNLRGLRINPKKGDLAEYDTVARALALPIDVATYLTGRVVGLCARFINYAPQFAPPGGCVTYKALDQATQKNAEKYLKTYLKTMQDEDPAVMRSRGYAYRRAWKKAEALCRSALRESAGALADVLHGERLTWDVYAGPADEAVQRLAATAAEFAAGHDFRDFAARYCRRFVRDPRDEARRRQAAARESALARAEAEARRRIAALLPAVKSVAFRYEASMGEVVRRFRLEEHAARPALGAPRPGPAADPRFALSDGGPRFALSDGERAGLASLRGEWFGLVGIDFARRQDAALKALLDERGDARRGYRPGVPAREVAAPE